MSKELLLTFILRSLHCFISQITNIGENGATMFNDLTLVKLYTTNVCDVFNDNLILEFEPALI